MRPFSSINVFVAIMASSSITLALNNQSSDINAEGNAIHKTQTKNLDLLRALEGAAAKDVLNHHLEGTEIKMATSSCARGTFRPTTKPIMVNPSELHRSYSTVYAGDAPGYRHGRSMLDSPQAWSAALASAGEWSQIDLGSVMMVSYVVTQPRADCCNQAVTKYTLKTSVDGTTFDDVNFGEVFMGVDANTFASDLQGKMSSRLPVPVEARYVRVLIHEWVNFPSMRWAVIATPSGTDCTPTCAPGTFAPEGADECMACDAGSTSSLASVECAQHIEAGSTFSGTSSAGLPLPPSKTPLSLPTGLPASVAQALATALPLSMPAALQACPLPSNKWSNYPRVYGELFAAVHDGAARARRGAPRAVVEIGVQRGGGLALLAAAFPDATVYGVDVNPAVASIDFSSTAGGAEGRIRVIVGDAADAATWAALPAELDFVLDDGSHAPAEQRAAVQHGWPRLGAGGVYAVEDLEFSFRPGGADRPFFEDISEAAVNVHRRFAYDGDVKDCGEIGGGGDCCGGDSSGGLPAGAGLEKVVQYSGVVAFFKEITDAECSGGGGGRVRRNRWYCF